MYTNILHTNENNDIYNDNQKNVPKERYRDFEDYGVIGKPNCQLPGQS